MIALAQAMPDMPVLATHGGGYESWAFRAHTGSLPNVLYDFSVTMAYYRGSDLLRPFRDLRSLETPATAVWKRLAVGRTARSII